MLYCIQHGRQTSAIRAHRASGSPRVRRPGPRLPGGPGRGRRARGGQPGAGRSLGHQSHGVLRLPWYVDRLQTGAMTARTEPAVLSDTGPLMLLDGRDGIGQVLTEHARQLAVERARSHGVGVVGVRTSNPFGTAMYWTRRA